MADKDLIEQARAWIVRSGRRCDSALIGHVYPERIIIVCDNETAGFAEYTVNRDALKSPGTAPHSPQSNPQYGTAAVPVLAADSDNGGKPAVRRVRKSRRLSAEY